MNKRRVVITGMGTVNPLGHDVESMWSAMLHSASGMSPTFLFDASTFPTKFSAQVKNYDMAAQVPSAERHCHAGHHSKFALGAAVQAWKQAGLEKASFDRSRCGIYLGSGEGSLDFDIFIDVLVQAWREGKVDTKVWAQQAFARMDIYREAEQESNMVVAHLAAEFGVTGPAFNVLDRKSVV